MNVTPTIANIFPQLLHSQKSKVKKSSLFKIVRSTTP